MTFKSPEEIVEAVGVSAFKKTAFNYKKLFLLSVLAGSYIAFGGLLAIKVGGGVPEIQANNPGVASLLFGAVFPVGLILVVLAGAELFTGNTAIVIPALRSKRISFRDVLKNWFVSYIGNMMGSLLVAYFFVYLTGILNNAPWNLFVINLASAKISQTYLTLILKAIACNWLVCLAVWLAFSSNQVSGKILGIWFPIMTFVALGFEHSVANMFFIPLGIFLGDQVTWSQFFINNLIPVTLGNMIGGILFVGFVYSYIYLRK